jgi:hypothetical protein
MFLASTPRTARLFVAFDEPAGFILHLSKESPGVASIKGEVEQPKRKPIAPTFLESCSNCIKINDRA